MYESEERKTRRVLHVWGTSLPELFRPTTYPGHHLHRRVLIPLLSSRLYRTFTAGGTPATFPS